VTTYSPTTALLIVDVQNDFAQSAGSLYVFGGEDTIPFINEQIEAARASGAIVLYTQDWHPKSTPHFAKDGGIWPVHCLGGSWGSELHPDLIVAGDRIRKGTGGEDGYSGFSVRHPVTGEATATELESILRERGITHVVVAGLATDYCVKETALDAARLGFVITVLADGVRAVNLEPGDGARAIAAMTAAGVHVE
jgi:nicotinamidase/pyrazinamidase